MREVKLTIEGEEVTLEEAGTTRDGAYEIYREPAELQNLGVGQQPLIVTVHVKRDWKPSDGIK